MMSEKIKTIDLSSAEFKTTYPDAIQKQIDMIKSHIEERSENIVRSFYKKLSPNISTIDANSTRNAHEAILNDPLIKLWNKALDELHSMHGTTILVTSNNTNLLHCKNPSA